MSGLDLDPAPMADALAGPRVALVTGAASGLGAATAEVLAAAGYHVVVADLDRTRAERTAADACAVGGDACGLELDVRDAASAEAAVEATVERFGRLDVLINNAGTDRTLPFDELSAAAFDAVLDVNLRGPTIMIRAALPELIRRRGHIVNIASTAAFRGWPNASAYHASKWGLRGLGQALFTELREHGVRVTTVFAGGMRTPFILDRFPDTPLDNLQEPHNVALAIRGVLDMPPESVVAEIVVLPLRETSWP